jgi:hypothetical protein
VTRLYLVTHDLVAELNFGPRLYVFFSSQGPIDMNLTVIELRRICAMTSRGTLDWLKNKIQNSDPGQLSCKQSNFLFTVILISSLIIMMAIPPDDPHGHEPKSHPKSNPAHFGGNQLSDPVNAELATNSDTGTQNSSVPDT